MNVYDINGKLVAADQSHLVSETWLEEQWRHYVDAHAGDELCECCELAAKSMVTAACEELRERMLALETVAASADLVLLRPSWLEELER